MQTIPGVGPALAATFIVEIGDIWRFDDFDIAGYAGVHPKEQSSGTKARGPRPGHMAKTGNSYLPSPPPQRGPPRGAPKKPNPPPHPPKKGNGGREKKKQKI